MRFPSKADGIKDGGNEYTYLETLKLHLESNQRWSDSNDNEFTDRKLTQQLHHRIHY